MNKVTVMSQKDEVPTHLRRARPTLSSVVVFDDRLSITELVRAIHNAGFCVTGDYTGRIVITKQEYLPDFKQDQS